jgi:hypothetical protein
MNCRPLLALALLLSFGLALSLAADEKIKESEYYPFAVGTTWNYTVNGKQKVTFRVAKHEKIGKDLTALVETVAEDKVVSTENVGLKDDGLYRFTMAGLTADPPVRILKLPAKKGDSWKVKSKVGDDEFSATFTLSEGKVKVLAGEYDALIAETDEVTVGGVKMTIKAWYAKNVGMVKMIMKIMGNEVTFELEKFAKGK